MLQRFIPVNDGGPRPEFAAGARDGYPTLGEGGPRYRQPASAAPAAQLLFAVVEDITMEAKAPELERQQREKLLRLEAPSSHSVIQLSESADREWSALQREIQGQQ